MLRSLVATLCLLAFVISTDATGSTGVIGKHQAGVLMQTWGEALESNNDKTTPVTRVVKLLKEMQATLQKEMDEDADLYDKLACWCNNNEYEKNEAISAAEAKIADLTSTIESLTAKSAELTESIKQLEEGVKANKESLATALALREKEAAAFHSEEVEAIQNIENLKAAIMVLERHHGSALPQFSVSFLSVGGKGQGKQLHRRDFPWSSDHETRLQRSFDEFLDQHNFESNGEEEKSPVAEKSSNKFLQQEQSSSSVSSSSDKNAGWTSQEQIIIQKALKSATSFEQSRQGANYMPSYSAQSGQILGVLKELKEEMEGNLSESQKAEATAAANFAELRSSKEAEIAAGEKQAEEKEDQLAKASMDLAEAKEDIEQTKASLSEDERFMMNLKTTCEDGGKNFEERKNARAAEIQAVSEAIAILMNDDARDTFSATYSFLQRASTSNIQRVRERAAAVLRNVANKVKSPQLSILASKTELDAFTRVKKAIDDMIGMLETQQADEVKKNDWCNSELQSNEMSTARAETSKSDLSAKVDALSSTASTLESEIANAKSQIAQLQVDLQRASENRQKENQDFQKTVADQRITQMVLKQALERLAKYYDSQFVQTSSKSKKQTPPVAQMEYKPNQGAEGIMQLLEKLIHEAKDLEKESIAGEQQAQAQYESVISDTNGSVAALMKSIATKAQEKAMTVKEKTETEGDLADTVTELQDLDKYNAKLHGECDYIINNFSIRQEGRAQEIEALKQAKQILSGADLS